MKRKIDINFLAKENIKQKRIRSIGLMLLVGMLAFTLFISTFMVLSLKGGMDSLNSRLGADILIVPEGYEGDIEGAILNGSPSNFYMKSDLVEKVSGVSGVKNASPQVYVATLSLSCCSMPTQIVGVDFNSDFIIKSWVENSIKIPLKDGEIIVGNNIYTNQGESLKFFEHEYTVAGKLGKTGFGFDDTIFTTIDEAKKMVRYASEISNTQLTTDNKLISNILVKLEDNANPREVYVNLQKELSGQGVKAMMSQEIMSEVQSKISNLSVYIYVLVAIVWLLAFILLNIVFSMNLNERKKEYGILRIIGATKKMLKQLCILESLYISIIGAVGGISISLIVCWLFNSSISESIEMPFLAPDIYVIASISLLTLIMSSIIGPLASLKTINTINKKELALIIKDND